MSEQLAVADVRIEVERKEIKNIHLTVHPPDGRVRIAAPRRTGLEILRLYAISKLPWIRRQREAILAQERESERECLDRESHYVWGRRCLMKLVEEDAAPSVEYGRKGIWLHVRPGTGADRRREILSAWYRIQVREAAGPLLEKWASRLDVRVERLFVQGMRTKWGSCNPKRRTIRLNTELGKKPVECLEYVTAHETAHLLEPRHNDRFVALMDRLMPDWTHRRDALNRLPVRHEDWRC